MARRFSKPEREFDSQAFSELVNKAIGDRTKTQFSEDTGLSLYYISRVTNGKINKAPRPNTISVIAAVAQNGVTYAQLLKAAGYSDTVALVFEAEEEYNNRTRLTSHAREQFVRMGIATVSVALARSKYKYYADGGAIGEHYDFVVHVQINEEMIKWRFQFLVEMPPIKSNNTRVIEELYYYYNREIKAVIPKKLAVLHTFVTESPDLYNRIVENAPPAFARYSAVMLIDTSTLSVIKSQILRGPEAGTIELPILESTNRENQ